MLRTLPVVALLLASSACSLGSGQPSQGETSTRVPPPKLGACRVLTPADVHRPSNSTPSVACTKDHTAETYAVGSFPPRLSTSRVPDDKALGAYLYHRCQKKFISFLGGDQSLVMRATVTWAWFRAPVAAWRNGAHWWRCDVVGGGEQSTAYVDLPTSAKGILLGKPDDRWMVCVDGPTVKGSVKIPCSKAHTWRAVTTIVLGKADDPYPGDRVVKFRTRDYCSNSVGAWLNYPVDYNYGYTWFHQAEWKAGNRRSICWAQTTQ